jgi:acetyltransferase-like isoleucine patch superfamily enzyme
VSVEDYATLGIGACVIQGRRIGRGAHVEPGAVVIKDVPAGATVGGVPATMERPVASRFVPQPLPEAQELPV